MIAVPGFARLKNGVLHQAANKGDVAGLRRHLTTQSDIDAPGKGGWTPLDVASYKGHAEIVQLLLEAGARIGQRSVQLAQEYGYTEIVQLLESVQKERSNSQK